MKKLLKRRKIGPKVDRFRFYDLVIYAARGSNSARRLATALGARRWRDDLPERYTRRRPYFRGNSSPMVLNWGSTVHPRWLEDSRFRLTPNFVNHADGVKKAIDKLAFFQHLSGIDGIPLLKWTDQKSIALSWLEKGTPCICRTKLGGSSGDGIVLARTVEELVDAPLYTRYYPKTHEFRVHVFNGKVIDLTQKKLKGGPNAREDSNTIVRSHGNGWVHAHGDISLLPEDRILIEMGCSSSIAGLGLLFGAVDVLAILEPPDADTKRRLKSFVVCEVNTGPGLENTETIEAYSKAIIALKNGATLSENNKNGGNSVERVP